MEEIKVGEYVRSYCIFKVVSIDTTKDGKYYRGDIPEWIGAWEEEIKSHSPNIIDLAEKDDYVNGKRIEQIIELPQIGKLLVYDTDYPIETELRYFTDKDIKDVVTKEQFESMKYHVGGKE